MKNRILLPIDFKEQSIIAIDYVKYFAEILKAEVHLLHVIEEGSVVSKLFSQEEELKKLIVDVQSLLDIEAQKFDNLKVVTKIKQGKVYKEIEDYILEIDPIFILIGKTEKPSLMKRLMGSNTLHLVNEVKNPVISITGNKVLKPSEDKREILVPLDFSKNVTEQMTAVIEFAKLLHSNIHLLTVDTTTSAANETSLLVKLNKAKKFVEEQGIKCNSTFLDDNKTPVSELINNFAAKSNAHLLIIMTRDQDNMKEFFIGSNARTILESCEIPVLSVKPWNPETEKSIFSVVIDPLQIFS